MFLHLVSVCCWSRPAFRLYLSSWGQIRDSSRMDLPSSPPRWRRMDGTLSTIKTIHPRTDRLNPYFIERYQRSQDRILNIHLFHHKPLKRADGDSHRNCGQQQGQDDLINQTLVAVLNVCKLCIWKGLGRPVTGTRYWAGVQIQSYIYLNILVAPLVCAYCNSPMIAFELLAKHEGSPTTRTTNLPAL